ncbi:hypothetical protein KIN20_015537 [Parelaphostrongylus tenuis]|uniref:ShKT domain-containing protein n=1 Tax=Parelaphostrongylus tenuis TaxID=148309 RepID=A0AAD5QP45_PARTN|nr:hypothetical protein KIN20_015537 [Parelaphostrongylus tenuis]
MADFLTQETVLNAFVLAAMEEDVVMRGQLFSKGPPGSTIEVLLDSFPRGVAVDGCILQELKSKLEAIYVTLVTASPGSESTDTTTPDATSEPTERPTSRPTKKSPRPPTKTPRPPAKPSTSNRRCRDTDICRALAKWDFCNTDEYDDEIKKVICPRSCGFC